MNETDIDRREYQGDFEEAKKRVAFCLDYLEKEGFKKSMNWNTTITKRLTLEEVIGALVIAEQQFKELEKYF